MKNLFGWTVIFRGGLIANLINMVKKLAMFVWGILKGLWVLFTRHLPRLIWRICKWPIIVALWILGINWYELQMYIYRKVRAN